MFVRRYFRGGSQLVRVCGPFSFRGQAKTERGKWSAAMRGERFEVWRTLPPPRPEPLDTRTLIV